MNQAVSWTAAKVRRQFLEFFKSKQHRIVPSAPIVIKGDPTLMFTNAGMNQFKDAFLGNTSPIASRVTDTQKCLRVSGKHNDLEEVGHDTYHHTMFEMLGNWSFGKAGGNDDPKEGGYFKKEAIAWAWELLTEVYGLDKERLYVTIFEGDSSESLERDTEAFENWENYVPKERILDGNKKDNFWEMGAVGPCGPSSEIHVDLRSEEERAKVDGGSLVNKDHPLVVEIWNLVFMEYNRQADGSLKKLPAQHVDTGMGFERLCMALQNKKSNYDTDVFTPLIRRLEQVCDKKYGEDKKADIAFRVIADHVRAVAFSIADGQLPSNNGAGYVIRRILRRAIRYGFSYLDKKEPFIYELVEVLAGQMAEFFPEIVSQKALATNVIKEEEASFLRTLDQGLGRLAQMIVEAGENKQIEGGKIFELYDTFGFPVDLTALILKERGYSFDEEGYAREMKNQRDRARSAAQQNTGDWIQHTEGSDSEFIGYDSSKSSAVLRKYRKVKTAEREFFQLVFDKTPFYPEGGGQIGDSGELLAGNERIEILDTKKEHGLILHYSNSLPANLNTDIELIVDTGKRQATAYHHSATHLLHQALREVLGDHVEQKGSLVNPEYLRFDFSHFSKVSEEEIEKVEDLINARIRGNFSQEEFRDIPMEKAKAMGAMALFGEKYGENVRAIKFGDSIELCGGIHARSTGELGLFVITSEGAVASGIRRIEALSGEKALSYFREKHNQLRDLQREMKNPKDLKTAILQIKDENSGLRKQLEDLQREKALGAKDEWFSKAIRKDDFSLIIKRSDLDMQSVKDILFQLKNEKERIAAVVGIEADGKAQIAIAFSDDLALEKNWHAGNMVRELARDIGGGGGGQAFFATAGGKNPEGLDRALEKAEEILS